MKPVWTASGKRPTADGIFERHTTAMSNATTKMTESSESEAYSQETKAAMQVSFGLFSAGASGGYAKSGKSGDSKSDSSDEVEKFTFSFESLFSPVSFELWDSIVSYLNSDGWYMEGEGPGAFWKNENLNARFVIAEAVFVQKLAFYSNKKEITQKVRASMNETSSSWNASANVGYGSFGSASVSHSESKSKAEEKKSAKANVNQKLETIEAGNLCLKFVLLKPVPVAPLRGGETCKQKQMSRKKCFAELSKEIRVGDASDSKLVLGI